MLLSLARIVVLAVAASAPALAQTHSAPASSERDSHAPDARDTSGCDGYAGESRRQCIEKILNSATPRDPDAVGAASRSDASAGGSRIPGAEGIGSGGSQGPGVGATGSGSSGTSRSVPGSTGDHSIRP